MAIRRVIAGYVFQTRAIMQQELGDSESYYLSTIIIAVIALATVAAYLPTLNAGFVNFDDDIYVRDNSHVLGGPTPTAIVWAFTSIERSGNWHPLTWISYMIDVKVFGCEPRALHAVNVLIHILNSALVYLLLFRATSRPWRSGMVAALFALHPLHVESVAWISERKDVLSTVFWLLAMLSYLRYCRKPSLVAYAGVAGLMVIGLMCKPMVVTLPLTLLLLDYWPLGRLAGLEAKMGSRAAVTRLVAEKLPLFALSAASAVITLIAQKAGGAVAQTAELPFVARFSNALVSYVAYIIKMIYPMRLAVVYPHPGPNLPWWQVALSSLALIGFTVFIVRRAKRDYLRMGWLWYLLTLVPVIGLVQVGGQGMADRYTYVPLIGLFVAIVWAICDVLNKCCEGFGQTRFYAPAALVLVVLAVLTHRQAATWKDSETLWRHALAVTTRNYNAHLGLGTALPTDDPESLKQLRLALGINPRSVEVHYNMGIAMLNQNRYDDAMEFFRTAERIDPDYWLAKSGKGMVYEAKGEHAKAASCFLEASKLKPDDPHVLSNAGVEFVRLGRFDDAARAFEKALKINPSDPFTNVNMGNILRSRGKLKEARRLFQNALEMDDRNILAYLGMANVARDEGDLKSAESYVRSAIELGPKRGEARYLLAVILKECGRYADAAKEFEKALEFGPVRPQILKDYAWMLATTPDNSVRNSKLAVELADMVAGSSAGTGADVQDTLAAAYASERRFKEAVATAEKALQLARRAGNKKLAGEISYRLELYKSARIYIEK
jgi:tetratricopeptide (TPR) repeat protein